MGTLHRLPPRKNAGAENDPTYDLRLFTTGSTPRSTRAVRNLQDICEGVLEGHYHLEIVDIYQEPGRASEANIIAAPTLVKYAPPPQRRIIGDLSDRGKVISNLSLKRKDR